MPLPFILGAGAAIAGLAGAGAGVHGAIKMKEANDTMKSLQTRQKRALDSLEKKTSYTNSIMDEIGKRELEILKSFEEFSAIWEKIQNKPDFKALISEKISLPDFNPEELKKVSVGAGVLLGGLGGAALGTAGGFAAAGATTAAVMALGTASTGTAIASLSGAAATNATLAALGGGALAAGGGGIALGTTILGAATLGVGVLVGGVIFNLVGNSISSKAEEAEKQVVATEGQVIRIKDYLSELCVYAKKFNECLQTVEKVYRKHLNGLDYVVNFSGKTDWNNFTEQEKLLAENTALLVGFMHHMCKTKLVLLTSGKDSLNRVNKTAIDRTVEQTEMFMRDHNFHSDAD